MPYAEQGADLDLVSPCILVVMMFFELPGVFTQKTAIHFLNSL